MDKQELKVLLIEDNAGDAFLIKFYLGESMSPRFNFFHADCMKAAHELLAANQFDIILMDLNLPDSVGLDTIKKLLETYPNNLVVVLTGLVDEKVGLETVRYGAQDFLVKGKFDGKVLISSIMFAFERFNLNKQLSSVASELNKGEERFDHIQKLFNAGYIEVDLSKRTVYHSAPLLKLLNQPADKTYWTIEETMANVVDAARIIEEGKASFKDTNVTEVTFGYKTYTNGDLKVRWAKVGDDKIIGAIFPA